LLGSTPFLVGEYTISCWGVHHSLRPAISRFCRRYCALSTPDDLYTCWGVHHFLLGSTPFPAALPVSTPQVAEATADPAGHHCSSGPSARARRGNGTEKPACLQGVHPTYLLGTPVLLVGHPGSALYGAICPSSDRYFTHLRDLLTRNGTSGVTALVGDPGTPRVSTLLEHLRKLLTKNGDLRRRRLVGDPGTLVGEYTNQVDSSSRLCPECTSS
jgi:hypothetical protein